MAKRPPFLHGRNSCIFCGAYGLTREHMFADWLRDYIPRTMTEHKTLLTIVHLEKDEVSQDRRTGDPHARRIRCVCKSCNNGWMSRLQEDVRPFLVPMLTKKTIQLHRRAQTVLAAWVAMMVMVAENVNRDHVTIPQPHRDWLRENQIAPKCWRIWIGTHNRQEHPLYSHRALPMAPKEEFKRLSLDPNPIPNTQTSTICLGEKLVIHAMSSVVGWSIIRRWKLPAPIRDGLDQIWPVRTSIVSWPKPGALTDAGIALLTDNFFDAATRLMRKAARDRQ